MEVPPDSATVTTHVPALRPVIVRALPFTLAVATVVSLELAE
jgi:hypothetical protein